MELLALVFEGFCIAAIRIQQAISSSPLYLLDQCKVNSEYMNSLQERWVYIFAIYDHNQSYYV